MRRDPLELVQRVIDAGRYLGGRTCLVKKPDTFLQFFGRLTKEIPPAVLINTHTLLPLVNFRDWFPHSRALSTG